MKCDLCSFETDSKERFAGHRSGHVRSGELPKKVKKTEFVCRACGKKFNSGPELGGHQTFHKRSFDQIKSRSVLKSHLILERGHRCEICQNEEWMGQKIPITIDHVDGNSDNNSKVNLRLLCPNCHAQTPTFCGKNVGNSERYTSAKAYWRRRFAGFV